MNEGSRFYKESGGGGVNHVKYYPLEGTSVEFWAVWSASCAFSIPKQEERF